MHVTSAGTGRESKGHPSNPTGGSDAHAPARLRALQCPLAIMRKKAQRKAGDNFTPCIYLAVLSMIPGRIHGLVYGVIEESTEASMVSRRWNQHAP